MNTELILSELIVEGNELMNSIEKLSRDIDNKLFPEEDEGILRTQLSVMTTYMNILTIRLNKLK